MQQRLFCLPKIIVYDLCKEKRLCRISPGLSEPNNVNLELAYLVSLNVKIGKFYINILLVSGRINKTFVTGFNISPVGKYITIKQMDNSRSPKTQLANNLFL